MGDRRIVIPRIPAEKFGAVCDALDRVGLRYQVDAAAAAAPANTVICALGDNGPREPRDCQCPADAVCHSPSCPRRLHAAARSLQATRKPPRRRMQYVGGRRFKGISGDDLVMEILLTAAEPHVLVGDIEAEFVKHNFSKNSAASRLSALVADKQAVRIREGVYCAACRFIPEKRAEGGDHAAS